MNSDHPVIVSIRENTKIRPADLDFILENGQNYRGVTLPAGVRRWPLGDCIIGAEEMASRGLGRVVTGFVLRAGTRKPIPHTWATPDHVRAFDPTLSAPQDHDYWGLPEKHRGRVNDIVARAFRGATSSGLPVELMRGGLKIPGLRPFTIRF
ncbi:hypothetical protein [Methylobacterium sp. D54C]